LVPFERFERGTEAPALLSYRLSRRACAASRCRLRVVDDAGPLLADIDLLGIIEPQPGTGRRRDVYFEPGGASFWDYRDRRLR